MRLEPKWPMNLGQIDFHPKKLLTEAINWSNTFSSSTHDDVLLIAIAIAGWVLLGDAQSQASQMLNQRRVCSGAACHPQQLLKQRIGTQTDSMQRNYDRGKD